MAAPALAVRPGGSQAARYDDTIDFPVAKQLSLHRALRPANVCGVRFADVAEVPNAAHNRYYVRRYGAAAACAATVADA
jgi:hypothetical protein